MKRPVLRRRPDETLRPAEIEPAPPPPGARVGLRVLPIEVMAASKLVAADAARAIFGAAGASTISALVALSAFGALTGSLGSNFARAAANRAICGTRPAGADRAPVRDHRNSRHGSASAADRLPEAIGPGC